MLSQYATGNLLFIGLTDEATEGTFVWIDGTVATEAEIGFATGEPNDADDPNSDSDCILLHTVNPSFNQAVDGECSSLGLALCERELD